MAFPEQVQKLLNRATEVITSQGYDTKANDLLHNLKWITLTDGQLEHVALISTNFAIAMDFPLCKTLQSCNEFKILSLK